MEQALLFFVYSMIVFLLAAMLGGALIGYYFTKKKEFELGRIKAFGMLMNKSQVTISNKSKNDQN